MRNVKLRKLQESGVSKLLYFIVLNEYFDLKSVYYLCRIIVEFIPVFKIIIKENIMSTIKEKLEKLTPEQRKLLLQRLNPSLKEDQKDQIQRGTRTDNSAPVSFSQQGLWFHDQMEGPSATYNIPFALRLRGKLDREILTACFNEIISRHEILRTNFVATESNIRQVIKKHLVISIECTKASEDNYEELAINEAHLTFDLSNDTLIRLKLLELSQDDHILLITIHHIISDGWSTGVLLNELTILYEAYTHNQPSNLSELPIQYADYSEWQRKQLDGENLTKLLDYWKTHLKDSPPLLSLPTDYPRPAKQTFKGNVYSFAIEEKMLEDLSSLSHQHGSTLFMTMLTAFYILLQKYSKQNDIAIGTTIANRTRPEFEKLIGFFVNMLVLRAHVKESKNFIALLQDIKASTLSAYEYQDLPFDQLVKTLQPERNLAYSPLFQVMFELQNSPMSDIEMGDLTISSIDHQVHVAKFDLTCTIEKCDKNLRGLIEYNTDLFNESTIVCFAEHYKQLLNSILCNPNSLIADLSILSEKEKAEILFDKNQTKVDFQLDIYAHQLFEAQVQKTPNIIAASCDGVDITYLELDKKSNQLAHALKKQGVSHEHCIALFLDRSIDYLIAMLAVLKSGSAFVPLDPNSNINRTLDIIDQCKPYLIISSKLRSELAYQLTNEKMIFIEEAFSDLNADKKLDIYIHPNSLAYVIYTSGSTGKPKGVMIEHLGMMNHLYAKIYDLNITHKDIIGQIAVQTFDVSIWQFICALMIGGRTAILTGDHAWEPRLLLEKIKSEGISILESVPSHTKVILDAQESNPALCDLGSLRIYMTNAEPLTPEQCVRWFKYNPNIMMINAYGATECSDDTHHLHMHAPLKTSLPYVPVREALPNLQAYILDDYMEPVPIGVRGEIYIGGIGVGRGYYQDPIRTANSYVPNPFSSIKGDRLYRTGDLARFHRDGMIEFLNRSDFQVKIQGFRIEIGEIESLLLEHPNVESVVILAKKDEQENSFLVAYIIPKCYPAPTRDEVQKYCRHKLPHYMIPAAILFLDIFPLSPNGKVDRKQLPNPTSYDFNNPSEYIAPSSEIELKIASVWSKVLHREKIGIRDNFFKIGGHSLLAAELAIKLQNELHTTIELRKLFEFPTIELLVNHLAIYSEKVIAQDAIHIETANVRQFATKEYYDLAPCQIPEWYAYQLDNKSPVYNISFCDLFYKDLNLEIFVKAWNIILDRHDNFRICFTYKNGKPVQMLAKPITLDVDTILLDYRSINHEEIDTMAGKLAYQFSNTSFDFENGPLFNLKIAGFPDNQYQLLFVVHHIIWDETSTMNLFSELAETYNALLAQKAISLKPLELNYFDYVAWMNESIQSGAFEAHRQYWLNVYHDLPPALDLPCDYPRPSVITFNGDTTSHWLSREQVRNLQPFLDKHNVTLFMFMMSVIDLYLFRITGQNDIVIGSPIAGRDHEHFKPILGLFASPMPIRCQLNASMTYTDLLSYIKNQSLEAFEHHYYPSNLIIEELAHTKDLSRPKLFSVMYGVQNNKTDVYETTKLSGTERIIKNFYGSEANSARFDLTLVVDQWGSDIAFNCIFNTDIFKKSTIQRMMSEMLYLLSEVIDNPSIPLSNYKLMPEYKSMQILTEVNQTECEYPKLCVHELFEQQVEKTPLATAIIYEEKQISYDALNKAVNKLAHYLINMGVKPGHAVGVILQPSPNMIISLLAILKISAHYVPISIDYPSHRIDDILKQANIKHIINDSSYTANLNSYYGERLSLDDDQNEINIQRDDNPKCECDHETIAYVLFTSGTTGQPKGIPIHHGGVVNLLHSTQKDYILTHQDILLAITPFTFDASILDIFWPLAYGATIVLPSPLDLKNPHALAEIIQAKKVSILQCVPIMLEAILGLQSPLDTLRVVIAGGAPLPRTLRDLFITRFKSRLMNHYGPTEITVDASRFDCINDFSGDIVPIGKPIANTKIFILDTYLNPVSYGIIGEIYIHSPGMTKGYLNDIDKTDQAFLYKTLNGKNYRLYKSGDLGKLSDDGNIYYIGRTDKQIKIRGNRVELEEIDSALLQHSSIKNAVVRYFSNNSIDGQLVAYLDYKKAFNCFHVADEQYHLFTVAEKPELLHAMNAGHMDAWPKYFEGSKTLTEYWPRLYSEFPTYQFGLLTSDDQLAAFGNAVPIYWDGTQELLPTGWDAALIASLESTKKPNTLLILAGIVSIPFQGKGLSTEILKVFKTIAKGHHLEKIVVAVRPTGKTQHQEVDFETWCYTRRNDGQLADNWLRIHERVGGKLLKVALQSQLVEGSIAQWEQWTGQSITSHNAHMVNGTLQTVSIDNETNTITYFDPAIWVEHYYNPDDQINWIPHDFYTFKNYLAGLLPAYMIPNHYYILTSLPLLENGKINEKSLPTPNFTRKSLVPPKTMLQNDLANIWKRLLQLDTVGIIDDFFELGGQSLKVIQMLAELTDLYGCKIPLCQFYIDPTIKGLEAIIDDYHTKKIIPVCKITQ